MSSFSRTVETYQRHLYHVATPVNAQELTETMNVALQDAMDALQDIPNDVVQVTVVSGRLVVFWDEAPV